MKKIKCSARWPVGLFVAALALFLFTGCKSTSSTSATATVAPGTPPAATAAVVPPAPTPTAAPAVTPAPVPPPVRIDAAASAAYTDSNGNTWLPDQGFADGDTVDRGDDVQIANTKDPAIYRTERYGMTSFSYPVPNGKYTVKLYFAETYEGITGPEQRVFSFNVEGQEFKDFDVFAKAGGALRACVVTANVEVTDGKLDISFTPIADNPEINGIEILPNQ